MSEFQSGNCVWLSSPCQQSFWYSSYIWIEGLKDWEWVFQEYHSDCRSLPPTNSRRSSSLSPEPSDPSSETSWPGPDCVLLVSAMEWWSGECCVLLAWLGGGNLLSLLSRTDWAPDCRLQHKVLSHRTPLLSHCQNQDQERSHWAILPSCGLRSFYAKIVSFIQKLTLGHVPSLCSKIVRWRSDKTLLNAVTLLGVYI